jgi:hypothetical protein
VSRCNNFLPVIGALMGYPIRADSMVELSAFSQGDQVSEHCRGNACDSRPSQPF